MSSTETRFGYVALAGLPNAGKSTLLNALVGQKVAGVSDKAHTTRHRITGLVNHHSTQIAFVDMPGMGASRASASELNKMMDMQTKSALSDADVICYLVDVHAGLKDEDCQTLSAMLTADDLRPLFIVVSKSDSVKKDRVIDRLQQIQNFLDKHPPLSKVYCLPVSAKHRDSHQQFLELLTKLLPEGPWHYDAEQWTDRSARFVISEMIREQAFRYLSDELPYQLKVRVDQLRPHQDRVDIYAAIVVGRPSHKGMVIGKGGQLIKRIGSEARSYIEEMYQKKVLLKLNVEVQQGWMDDQRDLEEHFEAGV